MDSIFQEEGLRKVYDIFASDVVEDDVKKAAVDQLGIMLQGKELKKFSHPFYRIHR